MIAHQPSHSLLQNAATRRGSAVSLVQTLHGFACLNHVSSSIRKAEDILSSRVI